MKGIARFAEYSISGGVLWLNVIFFITLLSLPADMSNGLFHSTLDVWSKWLVDFSENIQQPEKLESFKNALNTLAASLFVLLIFCTGLLLDIISPFICTQIEACFFKANMKKKDSQWFQKLAEENSEYLQNDYNKFISEPLFDRATPKVWWTQKKRYNRINSFLLAYLFANSNHVHLDQLTEKIRLWYTSRALTTSLLVLCVLLNFLAITDSVIVTNHASTFYYTLLIPLILVIISLSITIGAFCRVNNSMLALAYHIHFNKIHG